MILLLAGTAGAFADTTGGSWAYYGGDAGGQRYSTLTQINGANVGQLQVAWTYRTGDLGEGFRSQHKMAFETTPLYIDKILYLTTPRGIAIAIDAINGEEIWRFDPEIDNEQGYAEATSRGVTSWVDPAVEPGMPCQHRIFFGTLDARIIALDAANGLRCQGFASNGVIDLTDGIRAYEKGDYLVTSPPVVIDAMLITGSAIGDNRGVELERGTVRGYNAHTGELIWSWDPVPRDETDPHFSTWGKIAAERTGAANAWAPFSADEELGLVFVPTGAPSPDFTVANAPAAIATRILWWR